MEPIPITDKVARMMSAEDRKAAGVLLPEERQRKLEAKEEKELERMCELELTRRGIEKLHLSNRAREKKGWPDLTFAIESQPFAVELKTATGRVSEDQKRVMARLKANGWTVRVIRSYEAFRAMVIAASNRKKRIE